MTEWGKAPTVRDELAEWWLEIRGPLAADARRHLLKATLALGLAATITARAANKCERWIP